MFVSKKSVSLDAGPGMWRSPSLNDNETMKSKESSTASNICGEIGTLKDLDLTVTDTSKDSSKQDIPGSQRTDWNKDCATKPLDLDDLLVGELGQFGRFQLNTCILVAFPVLISAFMIEYIFSAASVPHRCQIPECGEYSKSSVFEQPWVVYAVPQTDSRISSCERFAPLDLASKDSLDHCSASFFNNSSSIPCENFVYAWNNSVVYDFDLGCQEWSRALAGFCGSVGSLVGIFLTGLVSDRYGRRVTLLLSSFGNALFGLLRAFSVSYPMYLALQFLQFALGSGLFISASVLGTELVAPKHRVILGCIFSVLFSVGGCLLATIAWLVLSWRMMIIVLYAPCFLMLLNYWFLPESLRWLLSKHKYDEARKLLEKLAATNKTKLSKKSLQALMEAPLTQASKGPGLLKTILSSRVLLRRVCTIPVWWISTTLVYYGLSINSTSLSDQMHLNYILSSVVEIPGYIFAMLVLDRIGRKATLSSCFLISAACNFGFVFAPADAVCIWRLALHLVGKLSISAVFTVLYLYTAELFPTECRNSLMAFSSTIGRFGSMIAPLTPAMMTYWEGLPSTLYGVMGLVSGLLVLTQPETLGTKLPDTLAEAEAI